MICGHDYCEGKSHGIRLELSCGLLKRAVSWENVSYSLGKSIRSNLCLNILNCVHTPVGSVKAAELQFIGGVIP